MIKVKKQSQFLNNLKFSVLIVSLFLFLFYCLRTGVTNDETKTLVESQQQLMNKSLKYILQWAGMQREPFTSMGVGQSAFINRKCEFTNCFVTDNRSYFENYTDFNVIVFAWPQLSRKPVKELPQMRSRKQKYVFASMESPIYYPACNAFYNSYFNWTWTYKHDSDLIWGYINVWDRNGSVIGPKKYMHWMKVEDMDPVSDEIKQIVGKKRKAAAWFVSNCHSKSGRERFVENLRRKLRSYNLDVDIYGGCDKLRCPRTDAGYCYNLLERDYYFYLSFENSFAEDYVTEKLLTALQHNTVPIVYGGANYSRFVPDGIYLNALSLGVEKLASTMNHLIQNQEEYLQYFRWKNHYSFHSRFEYPQSINICSICSLLNDKNKIESVSIQKNLVKWWTPPGKC